MQRQVLLFTAITLIALPAFATGPKPNPLCAGALKLNGDQHRGSYQDILAYFDGMDRSGQQKVGLALCMLPNAGKVMDLGCASGTMSHDIARLSPGLEVIGVDYSQDFLAIARRKYQAPNLSFLHGDATQQLFAPGSLAAVLNSSVGHEIISYKGFDRAQYELSLDRQVEALAPSGIFYLRDFVIPEGADTPIFLDLPFNDGSMIGEPKDLSTAALFDRYSRTVKNGSHPNGLLVPKILAKRPGFFRFSTTYRTATEFLLRKDYRDAWANELKEEYLYSTQSQFETAFRNRKLRILVSKPIYNPWIIRHRFAGQAFMEEVRTGTPIDYPPTNYFIVGEKISPEQGTELRESKTQPQGSSAFVRLAHYQNTQTGQIMDVIHRPHVTYDVVPWFKQDGLLNVVMRQG